MSATGSVLIWSSTYQDVWYYSSVSNGAVSKWPLVMNYWSSLQRNKQRSAVSLQTIVFPWKTPDLNERWVPFKCEGFTAWEEISAGFEINAWVSSGYASHTTCTWTLAHRTTNLALSDQSAVLPFVGWSVCQGNSCWHLLSNCCLESQMDENKPN